MGLALAVNLSFASHKEQTKSMNTAQVERMRTGKGFIAALDQSGGSTPKALALYGLDENSYKNETEMFDLVHDMRTRIIKSSVFNSDRILAVILFEMTMDRMIDGLGSAEYLWLKKGILPILKIDNGLLTEHNGVLLMKEIPQLGARITSALSHGVFGTKMRSVIKSANSAGIKAIVDQQFELGRIICDAGLIPILEPEVDINSPDKAEVEVILLKEITEHLDTLSAHQKIMLKLTLPETAGFYSHLVDDHRIIRIVALSGGYSRDKANSLLVKNPRLIASFSRALTEGLTAQQSEKEFDLLLNSSIQSIYEASIK